MTPAPTAIERVLVVALRLVPEQGVVFAGFNWPMLALRAARRLHAGGVTVLYEDGIVEDELTDRLPTAPTDMAAAARSPATAGSVEALFFWLRGGRAELTMLDAPIVDRRGNVNSTVVGDYASPKVRLAGSGGGTELSATGRDVVLICSSLEPRAYPEGVDYVTSPGRLAPDGEGSCLPGRGPLVLLTPLGLLAYGADGLLAPRAVFDDVTADRLRATFRWLPDAAPPAAELPNPTGEELDAVRSVLREARAQRYRVGEG